MNADCATSVAVAGDACIDVYVDTDKALSAVGGNAVNVAVNLAQHGIRSALFGVIGDDPNGDRICAALHEQGVGVDRLRREHGPSWVTYIVHDDRGVAAIESEQPGVAGPYTPAVGELDLLARFDHVHLVNLADPARTLEALADRNVSASYDFGRAGPDRPARMKVAFFARPESESDGAERLARCAVERGARLAIVTLGARGSLAMDGERVRTVPAEPIEPVDTLGAGDSFIAAFLASRLAELPVEAALEVASRHASRTCLYWGAWPQRPTRTGSDMTA